MTDQDDPGGPDERPGEGSGRKLDEDAAWRAIVENYGERPQLTEADGPTAVNDPAPADGDEPSDPVEPPAAGVLDAGWRERDLSSTPESWDDEGHFVPPPAPPVPIASPRRRLAWSGLAGAPLIMLIAVVLGISLPGWLLLVLAAGFVGGFVYLIATMPDRHDRGWPGDDGAVV